jgi:hypothetical protein
MWPFQDGTPDNVTPRDVNADYFNANPGGVANANQGMPGALICRHRGKPPVGSPSIVMTTKINSCLAGWMSAPPIAMWNPASWMIFGFFT